MKIGDQISGKVERIAKDGSGLISRPIGKPVGVYNVIPGETVKATVTKRSGDAIRGQLNEIVTASPDRVAPRCPYAGTCGGCKWQHVSPTRQLDLKLDLIRDAFAKHNVPCPITSVQAAPDPFYYRNRMDFVFGRDGSLGLKMPDKWWMALDLETCFLMSPESVELMSRVRAWSRSTGLPFWDSRSYEGFFRYLVIREGKNTGERMVTLLTAPPERLCHSEDEVRRISDEILRFAQDDTLPVTSFVWGINPLITELSISEEIRPLKGNPWIHEEVNGIRYKITPNAFFQTNTAMAARLQDVVIAYATRDLPLPLLGKEGDPVTVLDLYCGSGFFSLALAKRVPTAKIVGIELNAEAIACAKENAVANGLSVDYHVSKAEAYDWTNHSPNVVIVDPPRAGMHPDVIETLLTKRPATIIYVSCSVERFVKEWVGELGHTGLSTGYKIAEATALDLFPHTPHMECVFRLERID